MRVDPLKLPPDYIRLPVRLHPVYHKYLKVNALRANVDMADIVRVLIHLAPTNGDFQAWLQPRIEKHGQGIVVVRNYADGDWGPLTK